MPTQLPDLFAALAAPFDPSEVKSRQQAGRTLHYVTCRTVMNRLDEVLGPENWWNDATPGENSVLCRLTIRLPDGTTLTKVDAGGYAGMSDSGDDDKSGYSDGMKRVAVLFGVGRYLYRDGVPEFVRERVEMGQTAEPAHEPARPAGRHEPGPRPAAASSPPRDEQGGPPRGGGQGGGAPRSGKALFAFVKDMEQRHGVGLLKYLNGWAKLQDFPGRMVDWDAEQVSLAYAEATRKLATLDHDGRDTSYEESLSN